MISVASTLLLVSLVFGTVPSAWAAPVGTRHMDVKSMRRMETQHWPPMRREHHSATSYVPRDDKPAPVVARAGTTEPVPPAAEPKRVVRRNQAKREDQDKASPRKPVPRFKRDQVAKHERSDSTPKREVDPRKQDAASSNIARSEPAKREASTAAPVDQHKRADTTPPTNVERAEPSATPVKTVVPRHHHNGGGGPKKDCGKPDPSSQTPDTTTTPETKREEVKEVFKKRHETKPIQPIAIFRRALAWEDLD